MDSPLRIKSVSIANIKGIPKLEFKLGTMTVLRGANGTGKSSVIDAISSIFDGGHDPALIRLGADKGVVAICLSNGTVIKKTITQKGSTLDITTGDGLKVPKPAAFVQQLASGFSFDPLAFLQADKKKRAAFLLEAMPIVFRPEEIEAVTGAPQARALGLEELNQLRAAVYERRRDVNVAEKEAQALVRSVSASLPENDGVDWPAKATELTAKKQALSTEAATIRQQIESDARAAADAARQRRDEIVRKAEEELQLCLANIKDSARAAIDDATAEISAELQTVSADLATAEEKRRQQDRSIEARQQLAVVQQRAADLNVQSFKLTARLEALDKLKSEKLAELPIPGVEIQGDQILVGGVDIDNLNTQSQYFVAFQVASLRQGGLGFMVCDRVESIVGQQWAEFQEAAAASGFQVLVARSEADEPLAVQEVA